MHLRYRLAATIAKFQIAVIAFEHLPCVPIGLEAVRAMVPPAGRAYSANGACDRGRLLAFQAGLTEPNGQWSLAAGTLGPRLAAISDTTCSATRHDFRTTYARLRGKNGVARNGAGWINLRGC